MLRVREWAEKVGTGNLLALAALVLLGLIQFQRTIGFDLLPLAAPYWRNPHSDMLQHTVGYLAFLSEPWGFPPTVTTRLLDPQAVSIVYTDSIPWLALLLKAVQFGDRLHVLATFHLISFVLQPLAMASLLWAMGVRRPLLLFAGGAMALFFPPWIMRQFGHTALSGHWLILVSLALSVHVARTGLTWRSAAGFAALGALAAGVHAYHLVPVSVCAGAAILSDLLQSRFRTWLRALIAGAGYLAAIALAAIILGYAIGPKVVGTGTIGTYGINLIGPVFPQASAVFGQRWNGSWFTGYLLDPTGTQAFEGASFLGVGAILLILVAGALAYRRGLRPSQDAVLRFGPLTLGLVVLFLYAVGPKPYLGPWLLFDLTPQGKLAEIVGVFRAHSRFFWAAGYAAIAGGIVLLARGLPGRIAAAVALLVLALQAYDASELQEGVAQTYRRSTPVSYPAALWDAPALQGRPWRIFPAYACADSFPERQIIAELSMLAVHQGGATNTASIARDPRDPACAPPAALLADAQAGDRTLTVVVDDDVKTSTRFTALAGRKDCHLFGPGLICGAGLAGTPGLQAPPPVLYRPRALIQTIRFDENRAPEGLGQGWSLPEPTGIWAMGPAASFTLPLPARRDRALLVTVTAQSYAQPPRDHQRVEVLVDGRPALTWKVGPGLWRPYEVEIPTDAGANGRVTLEFRFPDARSPQQDDPKSLDPRVLGIGVRDIRLFD